ncbi:hypothetical protein PC116_g30002 [Phytophthora cactorum]|nr:hypothetical protein PC116_g30002 [Phytophthora cactorum]
MRIKDTTELDEDLKFSDETVGDVISPAAAAVPEEKRTEV